MKHLLMLAGAAALGFAAPVAAHPGNGHGNGHGYGYGYSQGHGYDAEDQGDDEGVGQGYDDQDEGVDRGIGYGVGGCPPGLAKKAPACVPPGLARQQVVVGQGVPMGYVNPYANPYAYGQAPYDPRLQYGASPYGSPYYGYGYKPYAADPRTMILQQIIGALVR